jgi:hypothetical protein
MPARRMNKTEMQHATWLEAQVRTPDSGIIRYDFEAIKLFIGFTPRGRQMWYTPDFFVTRTDGLEIHEIKGGHIAEDAYVKLTAAARMYPAFRFIMYQLSKRGWERKEICL